MPKPVSRAVRARSQRMAVLWARSRVAAIVKGRQLVLRCWRSPSSPDRHRFADWSSLVFLGSATRPAEATVAGGGRRLTRLGVGLLVLGSILVVAASLDLQLRHY